MKAIAVKLICLTACMVLGVSIAGSASAQSLPSGFVDELVVGGLDLPTAFTTLPDGRLLIAQKNGVVQVLKNGILLPTPFIDLTPVVNDYWDRGLLGIAADLNFASNGFVYLLYVYENDENDYSGPKTSRLVRVTAVDDVASPASQVVILGTSVGRSCKDFPVGTDCIPADSYTHAIGTVKVASDGTLFVTSGDAASPDIVDPDSLRAQNLDELAGKVLHITTTGAGLPQNPFWNGSASANRAKVWAYGLRNPFRLTIHPGSGSLFIGDVGWNTYEEVNSVLSSAPGVNFGWPCYEGFFVQSGYAPNPTCQVLYALGSNAVRYPLTSYLHNNPSGAAVAGGTFYAGTSFPVQYLGKFFFADYAFGFIRYFQVDQNGAVAPPLSGFGAGFFGAVYLDTDGEDILYVSIYSGEIRRIRYVTPGSDVSYLSDRTPTSATNGLGPVELDQSNGDAEALDGRVITLSNGQQYAKGLGVHANSDVRYALNGSCSLFTAVVGVDNEVVTAGSVIFQVYTDGQPRYTSPTLTGASTPQNVSVTLSGRNELRLVVTDAGQGGAASDHADWADALVHCSGDATSPTVTTTNPPPDATSVAVDADITATFSEAMTAASLTSSTVTLVPQGSTTPVSAVVSYDAASKTVTLAPNANLANSTTYTATIKGGVGGTRDLAGNPMIAGKTWSFTTFDPTPPTVTSVTPPSGSVGQTTTTSVMAIFSEPMDPSTLTTGTVTLVRQGSSTPVAAAVSYDVTNGVVTLDPAGPLAANTTYTATVKGGVAGAKDLARNPLATDRVWSFTTATAAALSYLSDRMASLAINGWGPFEKDRSNGDVGPADGTTITLNGVTFAKGLGVHAPSDIRYALNGLCSVFTAVLGVDDEVGANGSVVFQVWGDGTLLYDSGVMTGAMPGRAIHGQVTGVTQLALIVTDGGDGAPFDHGDWGDAQVSCGSDTTVPTVTAVSPTSGATGVPVSINATATFSEAMNPATLTTGTVTLIPQGGSAVAASVTYDAGTRTVTLDPTANLAANTTYTATVKGGASGAKDLAGNPLASDRVWTFVTGAGAGLSYLSDRTWTSMTNGWGPVERDRSNGDSGATDGGVITLNGVPYSKGLGGHAPSDVRFALNATCSALTAVVGVDDEVGANGNVVLQVWGDGLQRYNSGPMTGAMASKSVFVDLTGVTQLALIVTDGGDGAAYDHADWADARVTCADSSPPTVTAIAPASSATGVPVTTNVTATFSEAMAASAFTTTTMTLTRQGTSTPVAATVTYDPGTLTSTLDPTPALAANAIYTATVKSGAAGVKDLAGNPLATDRVWTFTTAPVDTTPPTVTSVTPAASAGGQTTTTSVMATFSEAMNPATITTATVGLTPPDSTTPLAAMVSYDAATRVVTLDPTTTLVANTTYTATVQSGATGVKDLAGNALATSRVWTFTTAPATALSYVSDRTGSSSTNGWGPVERDRSNNDAAADDGLPLTLNGVVYAKGLGSHAPSDVRYALNGACTLLTVNIGVDDEVGTNGSVVFQVWTDGVQRFDSGVMTGANSTRSVYVSVAGATQLALIVTDGGDAAAYDHADWADAQLSCAIDTTPPSVSVTSPLDAATGVALDANVTATFSEAMTASTLNTATMALVPQGGATPLAVTVTYSAGSNTVTLDPTADLALNTLYTATIKGGASGAKDLAGNAVAADKVWTFRTNASPTPTISQPLATFKFKVGDVITYSGSATDPEDGSIPAASLSWQIVLHHCPSGGCHLHPFTDSVGSSGTFTVPDHGDGTYFEFILTAVDSRGQAGTRSVNIDPLTVRLTLDTSPSGLEVVYGGTSATAPATFTTTVGSTHTILAPSPQVNRAFTSWSDGGAQQHNIVMGTTDTTLVATFAAPDTTPPTVTTVVPASGATGVPRSINATAAFSEAMNPATLTTGTVTLIPQGGSAVAASVTYDTSTRTVTLNPTANLAANTTYTATVKGGASGAKDLSGNPLATDRVWTFVTGLSP